MKIIIFIFCVLLCVNTASAYTYLDFDDFPAGTTIPSDSPLWEYSSNTTNNYGYEESLTSGWKSKTKWSDGYNWFFILSWNDQCVFGVDTYGYLDITTDGHSGNGLEHTITGGLSQQAGEPCGPPKGTELYCKEQYTGPSDIYSGGEPIGNSYLYFKKIDVIGVARDSTPYTGITDKNRWSVYVYHPEGFTNGDGGVGNEVQQTSQVGTFRDPASTGYHHYTNYYCQGGGWAKLQMEETTNGDNGGDGSTRYISDFLHPAWQFYITSLPYGGVVTSPYTIKYDLIEFTEDTYTPQNNETISNLSILYKGTNEFEISFNDKYKGGEGWYFSTYEVRYSFSPITNENWDSATPAQITEDTRFYIQTRADGKFQKWWPYYQGVWAPFGVESADIASLTAGAKIYFAVKDISQNPLDLTEPVDGINTYWGVGQGGRDYTAHPSTFDYANDEAALPLIKRIDYTIAGEVSPTETISSKGMSHKGVSKQ